MGGRDANTTQAPGGAADAARRAVAENAVWYHTIELAPGITTPGQVDMREVAAKLLPDDLSGKRALDIGTFDGFWAFEMERRGAEVVAIDVERLDAAEWPPLSRERLLEHTEELDVELGRGFRIASEALGSSVERVVCNVYDLSSEAIGGPVDFAFVGAILLHLRDPVRALERVKGALAPGGELRMMEPFSVRLSLRSRRPAAYFQPLRTPFNWWYPNMAAVRAWPRTAGFERIRRVAIVNPPSTKEMRQRYVGLSCKRDPAPGGQSPHS